MGAEWAEHMVFSCCRKHPDGNLQFFLLSYAPYNVVKHLSANVTLLPLSNVFSVTMYYTQKIDLVYWKEANPSLALNYKNSLILPSSSRYFRAEDHPYGFTVDITHSDHSSVGTFTYTNITEL